MNFPDPNVTTEYESPDGLKYVWNGFAWEIECGGTPAVDLNPYLKKYGHNVDDAQELAQYNWSKGVILKGESSAYIVLGREAVIKSPTSNVTMTADNALSITARTGNMSINSGTTLSLNASLDDASLSSSKGDLWLTSGEKDVNIKASKGTEKVERVIDDTSDPKQIVNKEYVDSLHIDPCSTATGIPGSVSSDTVISMRNVDGKNTTQVILPYVTGSRVHKDPEFITINGDKYPILDTFAYNSLQAVEYMIAGHHAQKYVGTEVSVTVCDYSPYVRKAGDDMTGDLTVGDRITLEEGGNIYAKQFNRVYVGNGQLSGSEGYDKTNTAVGMLCLDKNQGGYWNTGLGYQALAWLTTGKENVAVGYAAGSGYSSGSQNVALGYKALYGVTTGENNVGIGWNSGYYFEGSNNTIIGAYKGGAGDKELNKTVIISAGPTVRARCAENGDWTFYEKVIMRRTPTEDNHVANKEYVDDQIAALTARLNRLEGNG